MGRELPRLPVVGHAGVAAGVGARGNRASPARGANEGGRVGHPPGSAVMAAIVSLHVAWPGVRASYLRYWQKLFPQFSEVASAWDGWTLRLFYFREIPEAAGWLILALAVLGLVRLSWTNRAHAGLALSGVGMIGYLLLFTNVYRERLAAGRARSFGLCRMGNRANLPGARPRFGCDRCRRRDAHLLPSSPRGRLGPVELSRHPRAAFPCWKPSAETHGNRCGSSYSPRPPPRAWSFCGTPVMDTRVSRSRHGGD